MIDYLKVEDFLKDYLEDNDIPKPKGLCPCCYKFNPPDKVLHSETEAIIMIDQYSDYHPSKYKKVYKTEVLYNYICKYCNYKYKEIYK